MSAVELDVLHASSLALRSIGSSFSLSDSDWFSVWRYSAFAASETFASSAFTSLSGVLGKRKKKKEDDQRVDLCQSPRRSATTPHRGRQRVCYGPRRLRIGAASLAISHRLGARESASGSVMADQLLGVLSHLFDVDRPPSTLDIT